MIKNTAFIVAYTDGREVEYITAPIDVWRTEQFLGQPIVQAAFTFGGQAALAYFVAKRTGDAYRQKKDSTDEKALFEQWLETVDSLAPVKKDTDAETTADPTSAE
jgi:hypothetical protein